MHSGRADGNCKLFQVLFWKWHFSAIACLPLRQKSPYRFVCRLLITVWCVYKQPLMSISLKQQQACLPTCTAAHTGHYSHPTLGIQLRPWSVHCVYQWSFVTGLSPRPSSNELPSYVLYCVAGSGAIPLVFLFKFFIHTMTCLYLNYVPFSICTWAYSVE